MLMHGLSNRIVVAVAELTDDEEFEETQLNQ